MNANTEINILKIAYFYNLLSFVNERERERDGV